MTAPRPVTPVGILVERLRAVLEHAGGHLREQLGDAYELAAGLDPYLRGCTSPESPALRALAEATAAHDWKSYGDGSVVEQEMISGHVEGQLLQTLVYATRARQVLDVGMFTGYSALAMAEELPADGRVIACEAEAGVADFARRHLAAAAPAGKITVRVGPAAKTLTLLADEGETFELIFIDADKAGYLGYVDTILRRGLLAPHGLICVDNTLMQGQPWSGRPRTANGSAIAAFNAALAADPRVDQVLLPLRDGVTLVRHRGER